ncbi:MAG: hypothetical protein R3E42_06660 [Burkholderiaceae bacterium]
MSFDLPNLAKWRGGNGPPHSVWSCSSPSRPWSGSNGASTTSREDLAIKQVDSLMWQAYQLEREAGRLREALQNAPAASPATDPWALTERYEIFFSAGSTC